MSKNYYQIEALSSSQINTAFDATMLRWDKFWANCMLNPDRVRKQDTPAMKFGRYMHTLFLEPEKVSKEYFVGELNLRKKDDKQTLRDLEEAGVDYIPTSSDEKAQEMLSVLKSDKTVQSLVRNGEAEKAIEFEKYGYKFKTLLDYVRPGLVIDYKTVMDAAPKVFTRNNLERHGYHRQMALYKFGYEKLYGNVPDGVIIIAQEKEYPYSVATYTIPFNESGESYFGQQMIETAEQELDIFMQLFDKRYKDKNFKAFPDKPQPLHLSDWYKTLTIDGEYNG